MKLFKKIIAAGLAACFFLSMTACSDTTWVFDYNGEKIASGLYIAYTMSAYSQIPSQEGYSSAESDMMKQVINSKPAEQWVQQEARKYCDQYVAVNRKFAELDLHLSEDDIAVIDQTVKSNWTQIGSIYEDNGVAESSYRKLVESGRKSNLLFSKYYGKGGIEEVPAEKLQQHFIENFASINMFRVPLNTGDSLTDEQKKQNEERKAKAEELVAAINEGKMTFGEALDTYGHFVNEDEHDEADTNDKIMTDEESRGYIKKDSASYSEKVLNAIFNELIPDGEAKLIADDNVYYVAKRYDVTKDEKNFEEMRESVLSDIKMDDFNKMVENWGNELKPTVNDAAVKRYTPKNIDMKWNL